MSQTYAVNSISKLIVMYVTQHNISLQKTPVTTPVGTLHKMGTKVGLSVDVQTYTFFVSNICPPGA